jgi:hypothetical protein
MDFKFWLLLLEAADDEVESIKQRTNPLFTKALGASHDWVGETLRLAQSMGYRGGDILPVVNGAMAKLYRRLADINWGNDPFRVFRRAVRFDISHVGQEEFQTRRPHRDIPLSTLSNGDKPRDFSSNKQPPDAEISYQSYKDSLLKELSRRLQSAKEFKQLQRIQRAELALQIAKIQLDNPYDRAGLGQLVDMFPQVKRTTLYKITLEIQDVARSIFPHLNF